MFGWLGSGIPDSGVDLQKALTVVKISARAIPLIMDRYTVHHEGLGGAVIRPARRTHRRYHDIIVLGNKVSVFGTFDAIHAKVNLRSHGSRYESDVPIIANTPPKCRYGHNYDVVAQLSHLDA